MNLNLIRVLRDATLDSSQYDRRHCTQPQKTLLSSIFKQLYSNVSLCAPVYNYVGVTCALLLFAKTAVLSCLLNESACLSTTVITPWYKYLNCLTAWSSARRHLRSAPHAHHASLVHRRSRIVYNQVRGWRALRPIQTQAGLTIGQGHARHRRRPA